MYICLQINKHKIGFCAGTRKMKSECRQRRRRVQQKRAETKRSLPGYWPTREQSAVVFWPTKCNAMLRAVQASTQRVHTVARKCTTGPAD